MGGGRGFNDGGGGGGLRFLHRAMRRAAGLNAEACPRQKGRESPFWIKRLVR
jgi:hypothetical protein